MDIYLESVKLYTFFTTDETLGSLDILFNIVSPLLFIGSYKTLFTTLKEKWNESCIIIQYKNIIFSTVLDNYLLDLELDLGLDACNVILNSVAMTFRISSFLLSRLFLTAFLKFSFIFCAASLNIL